MVAFASERIGAHSGEPFIASSSAAGTERPSRKKVVANPSQSCAAASFSISSKSSSVSALGHAGSYRTSFLTDPGTCSAASSEVCAPYEWPSRNTG